MNGSRINDENWKTLHRIATLLLALADLANAAGRRSPAVRCLILWPLGLAEMVARDYLAWLTGHDARDETPPPIDISPAGAVHLAARLCALAAAFAALAIETIMSWRSDATALIRSSAALRPVATFPTTTIAIERRDSS